MSNTITISLIIMSIGINVLISATIISNQLIWENILSDLSQSVRIILSTIVTEKHQTGHIKEIIPHYSFKFTQNLKIGNQSKPLIKFKQNIVNRKTFVPIFNKDYNLMHTFFKLFIRTKKFA